LVSNQIQMFIKDEHLDRLPETLTGEILDGRLYTKPRLSTPHALVGSMADDLLIFLKSVPPCRPEPDPEDIREIF